MIRIISNEFSIEHENFKFNYSVVFDYLWVVETSFKFKVYDFTPLSTIIHEEKF